MNNQEIRYGLSLDDRAFVRTLSDELRYVECMKLYKSGIDLSEALTDKAKEVISLID
jgi:hypothetical protein